MVRSLPDPVTTNDDVVDDIKQVALLKVKREAKIMQAEEQDDHMAARAAKVEKAPTMQDAP